MRGSVQICLYALVGLIGVGSVSGLQAAEDEADAQLWPEKVAELRGKLRTARDNDEGAKLRRAVRRLKRLIRDRDAASKVKNAARAVLSAHYRKTGVLPEAAKLVEDFSSYEPSNLTTDDFKLRGFLSFSRCLASDGRIRSALKHLRYAAAEDRTEGWHRSMVLATQAGIFLDTNAFEKAIAHLRKSLDYGNEFYEPKHADSASSAEPQKVPGTDKWKAYRPKIQKALKEAKKQRDIAKYGKGFAYWRIARRAHLNGNYKKAATKYELITRMFSESVYAQGAGYWKAITHLERGNKDNCVETLQAFVADDLMGLYRGKALYRIATLKLHRDWDSRAARKYFRKTGEWTRKVRNREKDIDLYVVPDKAQDVTKPPEQPLKKTDRGALVPVNTKPRHLVCRQTADWYLRRLAWRTRFHLGFLAFVDEEYDTAKQHWTKGFELNKQLQEQHNSQLGSFYQRLMNACRGERFIATPREMEAFANHPRLRLKLMTADFYALWLRWGRAERLYRSLLGREGLAGRQKAVVLHCLAQAEVQQGNKRKGIKLFKRVAEKYPGTAAAQPAFYRLAMNSSEPNKAASYLRQAHELNPRTKTGLLALFQAGNVLWNDGQLKQAENIMQKVVGQYPDSVWTQRARDALGKMRRGLTKEQAAIQEKLEQNKEKFSAEQRKILRQRLEKLKRKKGN